MWPFRKKKIEKKSHIGRRVVAGLIIGGAVGSIVGKKLLEQHDAKDVQKDDDEDENGFSQTEM